MNIINMSMFVIILYSYEAYSTKDISLFENKQSNIIDEVLPVSPPKFGWVDPYDMMPDQSPENLYVQSDVDNYVLSNRLKKCEIYLRRFVNLFLQLAKPSATAAENPAIFTDSDILIKLEFFISKEDLQVLQDFGEKGESGGTKIESVNKIISKVFSTKNSKHDEHTVFNFQTLWRWTQKAFVKFTNSPEWTVVFSVLLMVLATLWFAQAHSFQMALLTFVMTVFLCGFGFTWIRMYEEKEVEKYANLVMYGDVPEYCKENSLPFYKKTYYRMFGANCIEFYKMRDVSPMVKISPTDVLAETVSSMIINPASNIGKAFGMFVSSFSDSFPWYLKPLVLPMACFMLLFFMLLMLSFLFKCRISLSLTGLHIIPTWLTNRETIVQGPKNNEHYIEDISNKENDKLKITDKSEFGDSKTPLYVAMNWSGFQRLISRNDLTDNINSGENVTTFKKIQEDEKSKNSDSEDENNKREKEKLLVTQEKKTEIGRNESKSACIEGNTSTSNTNTSMEISENLTVEPDKVTSNECEELKKS